MSEGGHHGRGFSIATPLLWLVMLVVVIAGVFMVISYESRLSRIEESLFICIEVEPVGTAANTFLCRPLIEETQ